MTAREPSAVEVIAEALYESVMQATADDWPTWQYLTDFKREPFIDRAMVALVEIKAAGFVVATRDAIRAMSVQEQADLIGAEVQAGYHFGGRFYPSGADDEIDAVRAVSPWRELIDAGVTRDHEEDER